MNSFGKRLEALRKSRGITQTGLAEILGKAGKGTISAWETDRAKPTFDELERIADYFEVSIDYLVKGKTSEAEEPKGEYIKITKDELITLQKLAIQSQAQQIQNQSQQIQNQNKSIENLKNIDVVPPEQQ